MPQKLSSNFLREKILPGLPHFNLQIKHRGPHSENRLLEVSIHSKGLPMQKLLYLKKRTVFNLRDRFKLVGICKSETEDKDRERGGWWFRGDRREYTLFAEIEIPEGSVDERAADNKGEYTLS